MATIATGHDEASGAGRGDEPTPLTALPPTYGEEAVLLRRIAESGVSIARGGVVPLDERVMNGVLEQLVHDLPTGHVLVLRPWFSTAAILRRCEKLWPQLPALASGGSAREVVRAVLETTSSPRFRAALAAPLTGVALRALIVALDEPSGRAASCNPDSGDPDEVLVWTPGSEPWRVDRRSTRFTHQGEPPLHANHASRVADLVDRAQLVLGRPVEVEWHFLQGRAVIGGIRPLYLEARFTSAAHRRLALVAADEGTVSPLAVDALDRALRSADELAGEPRVIRAYARPYRRVSDWRSGAASTERSQSLSRVAARAARLAAELAVPVAAATRFKRALEPQLEAVDRVHVSGVSNDELVATLRDRMRLAADAIALLDRERAATRAVIPALEAAVGAVPRECIEALAAPRPTRARRRAHERLARLTRRIREEHGELLPFDRLSPPLQREVDEQASLLTDVRDLGIDVRPTAFGESRHTLLAALRAGHSVEDDRREQARRDAVRRLRATARSQPLARPREGVVSSLVFVLERVADAKGTASEVVAATLLRLRKAALEAGKRLVDEAVLDQPDDALYLDLEELEQALNGEPGAYAARVRLRREDDARWANFEAPTRIGRRA